MLACSLKLAHPIITAQSLDVSLIFVLLLVINVCEIKFLSSVVVLLPVVNVCEIKYCHIVECFSLMAQNKMGSSVYLLF